MAAIKRNVYEYEYAAYIGISIHIESVAILVSFNVNYIEAQ